MHLAKANRNGIRGLGEGRLEKAWQCVGGTPVRESQSCDEYFEFQLSVFVAFSKSVFTPPERFYHDFSARR